MFLKKLQRRKNGKNHVYWALVESYRTPKGPRNRVVAYLGELKPHERKGWARLASTLGGKSSAMAQKTLFAEEPVGEPVPENVTVDVQGVRVEGTTDFGDVWLALTLWRALELDTLFNDLLPKGREEVEWALMVAILVLARFCEPSSERQIEQAWYPRTSLPELLGVPREQVHLQRLYRTLDVLVPHKEAVEKHLAERLGELFDLDYELLIYDITSTYFEGEARRNPQAKRGYSRDKRPDCKQICIALVVTTDGMPLGFEVFDGNRIDVTTIEEIVETMERKYGKARRIWALDRGMVSEENLRFIRERGGCYIVGTPRSDLRRYERQLTEGGWSTVYEDLEVKLCPSPDGQETFVLCRSAARAAKERAMHERFSTRIEAGLEKLRGRLARARKRPNRSQVDRQLGRLLGRNSRAAGKYRVEVTDDPERRGHLRVSWTCREEWSQWAILSEGVYLLRTNLVGWEPEALWKTYIQLTDVEAAFRTIKSDLVLRPIYHQIERRVHGHILVAFLSYALWKTLQKWMEAAGLGRGVGTVVSELARIKCSKVILPTSTGRELQLSCITKPDKWQQSLLERLRLEVPPRLGQPKWRNLVET
ncbi:MAG: IS1634 family transposase [Deltaproteobacteria bacterium]|nr:IS1634 family transposase [Deltaproteobacteria bacterium]